LKRDIISDFKYNAPIDLSIKLYQDSTYTAITASNIELFIFSISIAFLLYIVI